MTIQPGTWKKILLTAAACLLLLAIFPLALAEAEDDVRYIVPMETADYRLKLRDFPSEEGDILGQYYAGTEVRVLSEKNGWAEVNVGGRSGWMMSKFLTGAGEKPSCTPPLGKIGYTTGAYADESGVYGTEVLIGFDGSVIARMPAGSVVSVLGSVDKYALHVEFTAENGKKYYGKVSRVQVLQFSNGTDVATVKGSRNDSLVGLREEPGSDSRVICRLYSGSSVNVLFDDKPIDNYSFVRAGNVYGYINKKYLVSGRVQGKSRAVPAFGTLKEETYPLDQCCYFSVWNLPGYEYMGKGLQLMRVEPFQILGKMTVKGVPCFYCYGMVWIDEIYGEFGWFELPESKVVVWASGCIPCAGKVTHATSPWEWWNGERTPISENGEPVTLEPGTDIVVTNGYPVTCEGYVGSECQWVYADVYIGDEEEPRWVDVLLPRECVEFDTRLILPEGIGD